jgi:DNA-directed RNA polymerase specialized sigma24 family protein
MAKETAKQDVFPNTMRTWIHARLDEGNAGRDLVNKHIMSVYSHPLKVYFLGSSLRTLGEAEDMVAGFFASRLDREGYFDQWQESGLRLRRWLMNGFLFHLREEIRRQKRDGKSSLGEDPITPMTDSPDADFDRAWAIAMVRDAWSDASMSCEKDGLGDHWRLFIRHHVEGLPYKEFVDEFEVSPSQAAVMVRTATTRFKNAVRDRILIDGVRESEVNSEIERLMEIMT